MKLKIHTQVFIGIVLGVLVGVFFRENALILKPIGDLFIRLLKMIHFNDWVSYYAALLNNVDPTPVNKIQELKLKIAELV